MSLVRSFVEFDDRSVHVVFSDKSSLIIHADQNTLSYFAKNGQRSRQTIVNSQTSDNFPQKLRESLLLVNRYTGCLNMVLPSIQESYDEVVKQKKVQTCFWDLEQNPVQVTPNGVALESVDRMARVSIQKRTLSVVVTYQHYIPNRINVIQPQDQNKRDFVNSFLTKHKIPTTTQQEDKVQLGYTYATVTKEYSLFNFPKYWILPITILVGSLEINSQFSSPIIPEDYLNFISIDQMLSPFIEQRMLELYSTTKYSHQRFSTVLPTAVTTHCEQTVGFNLQADELPPASDFLSQAHLSGPTIYVSNDFRFWFFSLQSQIVEGIGYCEHEQDRLYYRLNHYWHQMVDGQERVLIEGNVSQLQEVNILFKHLVFRVSLNQQPKQLEPSLDKSQIYEIVPGDMSILTEANGPGVGSFVALRNGSVKCRFVDRTIVTFIYPPPCDVNLFDTLGCAYKIHFSPEIDDNYLNTIKGLCRIVPEQFRYYVETTVEFAEECFVRGNVQEMRHNYRGYLDGLVNQELVKGTTFLYMTGQQELPQSAFEMSITSQDDLQEQIQRLMRDNQEMLKRLEL